MAATILAPPASHVISEPVELPSRSEIVVWSVPHSQTPILSPETVLESIVVCEIFWNKGLEVNSLDA